jgi:hypothetical protein
MSVQRGRVPTWEPWKWAAIAMGLVISTALLTSVVMARYGTPSILQPSGAPSAAAPDVAQPQTTSGQVQPPAVPPQSAPPQAAPPVAAAPAPPKLAAEPAPASRRRAGPSRADIDACNRYAGTASDRTTETVRDALVGGAAGAGLGAAGGAIADGGSGAGKGAGIGGLVGAAAGTLFGLNDANQREERTAAAYRECMRRRGYVD